MKMKLPQKNYRVMIKFKTMINNNKTHLKKSTLTSIEQNLAKSEERSNDNSLIL